MPTKGHVSEGGEGVSEKGQQVEESDEVGMEGRIGRTRRNVRRNKRRRHQVGEPAKR